MGRVPVYAVFLYVEDRAPENSNWKRRSLCGGLRGNKMCQRGGGLSSSGSEGRSPVAKEDGTNGKPASLELPFVCNNTAVVLDVYREAPGVAS